MIESHPDCNVIVTTHGYLYTDGTRFSTYDYPSPDTTGKKDAHNGDELWDALIRKHENIVMTLSGHAALDRIVKTVSYGDHGNRIVEMLINPQETDTNYKGTGLVAMLYFSDNGRKVDLEYYSTEKLQYFYECNQFSFDMPHIDDEHADINRASVSIGKDITVNYYAQLSEAYENAVMRFTVNGKVTYVSPKATEYSGKYVFEYKGIAPHMLGDEIVAELMLGDTVLDTADVFSVEAYARQLLKMDKYELTISAEEADALHKVLSSLLNYGAEAQKYTDHNTESLVNDKIEANGEFDPDAITSIKDAGEVLGNSGAKFVSSTVRFDNVVFLRFDFVLGTAALSDATVVIGDRVYTSADFIEAEDGTYSIYTEAISAAYFDKSYTAQLKIGGEDAHSITYSVNSYVKAMYENEKIGELAKALYFYGAASEKYVKEAK